MSTKLYSIVISLCVSCLFECVHGCGHSLLLLLANTPAHHYPINQLQYINPGSPSSTYITLCCSFFFRPFLSLILCPLFFLLLLISLLCLSLRGAHSALQLPICLPSSPSARSLPHLSATELIHSSDLPPHQTPACLLAALLSVYLHSTSCLFCNKPFKCVPVGCV